MIGPVHKLYRYWAPSIYRDWRKATPHLTSYRVVKTTSKGWWIDDYGEERWVGRTRKAFAYPTIDLARDSYKRRQAWRVKHCQRHLNMALWCRDQLSFDQEVYYLD